MAYAKLPDNCVQYDIFPLDKKGVVKKSFEESKTKLEEFCEQVYAFLAPHLVDFIWQAEPFRLVPFRKPFAHAGGRTIFSDSIEDEWFIVWLLIELSKSFENAAIAIYDNDGQFLLIEAAEHLPEWLGPENAMNRVWIHRGQIHIIPEVLKGQASHNTLNGDEDEEEVSVEDALAWLAKDPSMTVASKNIQQVIKQRISGYPKKIGELKQVSHCCVPAAVAVLARTRPSLLSAAVQAFYLRDPIDLKACRAMKHFPPETRVLSDITTSKLQYAQLVQQKYFPDKRTGWDLPSSDDPSFKALDLGVKIACGFEVLCAYGERVKDAMTVLSYEDLEEDKGWKTFWASVEKSSYLQNVKLASEQYISKQNKAKDFFIESRRTNEVFIPRERYGAIILKMLKSTDVDSNVLKKRSFSLPPADDDSWMNIDSDKLDSLLEERSGSKRFHNGNGDASSAPFDPSTITESIRKFMETVSGFDGAEFPDEKDDGMDTSKMDQAISQILELHISDDEDNNGRVSSAMTDYSDEEYSQYELSKGNKNLKQYFQQMDRELAKTAVGQSFVTKNGNGTAHSNGRTKKKSAQNGGISDRKKAAPKAPIDSDDEEDYRPVDVNVTLLKNILESCSSEQGMPGPASNMLKRMGVYLPADNNKDSDDD